MSRKILVAILLVSSLAAVGAGYYGRQQWRAVTPTMAVVTAARAIPPYVLITRDMLAERQLPESLRLEPIFLRTSDVVGKMSSVSIPAGGLVYREFAVPMDAFRLSADPALEIVSFPARPEKAVGGQIRPGQRINVYRVAIGTQTMSLSPEQALATKGAESKLLTSGVRVVDVRTAQGEAPEANGTTQDGRGRSAPPTIITVAVPSETARAIIALAGETRGSYDLWVTLAPLDGQEVPVQIEADRAGGQP